MCTCPTTWISRNVVIPVDGALSFDILSPSMVRLVGLPSKRRHARHIPLSPVAAGLRRLPGANGHVMVSAASMPRLCDDGCDGDDDELSEVGCDSACADRPTLQSRCGMQPHGPGVQHCNRPPGFPVPALQIPPNRCTFRPAGLPADASAPTSTRLTSRLPQHGADVPSSSGVGSSLTIAVPEVRHSLRPIAAEQPYLLYPARERKTRAPCRI